MDIENGMHCEVKECQSCVILRGQTTAEVCTQRVRAAAQAIGWVVWRNKSRELRALCRTHRKLAPTMVETSQILPASGVYSK